MSEKNTREQIEDDWRHEDMTRLLDEVNAGRMTFDALRLYYANMYDLSKSED